MSDMTASGSCNLADKAVIEEPTPSCGLHGSPGSTMTSDKGPPVNHLPVPRLYSQADDQASPDYHPSKEKAGNSSKSLLRQGYTCLTGAFNSRAKSGIEEGRRAWTVTLIQLGPLSGVLAIVLALFSIIASLGVLAGSDKSPVAIWPTPPSTYIAIFTAVGNLSIRYAASQGVLVAWWAQALRGSSLDRLHERWRSGTSIRGALVAGRQMGWLGLACLFSTLIVIDGPLLQRSSTVGVSSYRDPVTLDMKMFPQLPTGYTGLWTPSKDSASGLTWNPAFNGTQPSVDGPISNYIRAGLTGNVFDREVRLWSEDRGFPGIVSGCPGVCKATLVAPALAATSCVNRGIPVDLKDPWPLKDIIQTKHAFPLVTEGFLLGSEMVIDKAQEEINMVIGFAQTKDCVGTINFTVCTLKSAIGEYDITISDDTIKLDAPASPKILSIATNADVLEATYSDGNHLSTLGGVVSLINTNGNSLEAYMWVDGVLDGQQEGAFTDRVEFEFQRNGCPTFTDPRDDYLGSMNKMMVLFGLAASRGQNKPNMTGLDERFKINPKTIGSAVGQRSVFNTDYSFFGGAVIVEVICICLILPTYWGWWKIGRSVSFSPLEIAKAFEAPLMTSVNSNSSGREIAQVYKDRQVRYGASLDDKGTISKLAFVEADAAETPKSGTFFDA